MPAGPAGPAYREISDRLIDAALRCVARWGLAKTALEDVAREAGSSRATLYRTFPGGKDALFAAVVDRELGRLYADVSGPIASADGIEDALVGAVVAAARRIEGHAALRFLFVNEPGLVLPHLAFHRLDVLLSAVSSSVGPLLRRFLPDDDEGPRIAEWVARIVISYLVSPAAGVRLTDDASVRRVVRTFVLPGVGAAPATSAR